MLQQKQLRLALPKACALDKATFSLQYDRIWEKISGNKSLVTLELKNSARLSPLIKLLDLQRVWVIPRIARPVQIDALGMPLGSQAQM